ncbi:MAG TPA: hypothetical protein VLV89_10335 [Candidatus Acidoferrum sp.]|nr:hypothetical protein [Candidatus Acidoferrum sp.]
MRELERLMRAGRLPRGTCRRFGIAKHQAHYHRKHLGRGMRFAVYYRESEWARRRQAGERIGPWRWKPGFCPNPAGRPRGAKDKRRRARAGSGVVEAIRARRAENATRWKLMQTLALAGE